MKKATKRIRHLTSGKNSVKQKRIKKINGFHLDIRKSDPKPQKMSKLHIFLFILLASLFFLMFVYLPRNPEMWPPQ